LTLLWYSFKLLGGKESMSPERERYHIDFEEIVSNAKDVILKDGKHAPILIIDGDRELLISQLYELPATHQQRVELMRFVGMTTAMSGKLRSLEQVFMVSEGWMSVARKDSQSIIPPSQDPDRKEVLIVSGLQLEGNRKHLRLFEILRYGDNNCVDLHELVPSSEKDGPVEVPLLDAFVHGFQFSF